MFICDFCLLEYSCTYYEHVKNNNVHIENVRRYYKECLNCNFSKGLIKRNVNI